ncbi:hypothetical protein KNE206_37530 [Kitasatospora sp. NE20-6]|uniref:sensor histidine kinase n=1 Tax=Kitasatospora sp. NE20-6 TaxID=2859066 RepID=UPI0034DC5052
MTAPSLPQHQYPPPSRARSTAARLLLATAVGAAVWFVYAAALLGGRPPGPDGDRIGAALLVDLLLGAAAAALLTLRHRHPLAVACLALAACTASVSALGPAVIAVASTAARPRRGALLAAGAVAAAAGALSEGVYRPRFVPGALAPGGGGTLAVVSSAAVTLLIVTAAAATGALLGARRDLLASLEERARTAERARELAAQAARDTERTRIAREMHDQLAHRISLVALHAGALVYREDLGPAEITTAAQTIRTNASLALAELRDVLGVLRDGDGSEGGDSTAGDRPDRSQPTLAELSALLADAREAGAVVRLDTSGLPDGTLPGRGLLPDVLSGASFRVVQEALTNARKHAPDEPVDVRLDGSPGGRLAIEVRNRRGFAGSSDLPSAGVGLTGLDERARLAGGTLEHGATESGEFVVRACLPWPA